MSEEQDLGALFVEAAALMARLRGTGGCPWDQEQTPQTIRKYTLEETYEVLDAIERADWPNLCEELGDLLLQILFYAQMAEEAGHFSLANVLAGLNRKLVRRHPHVFGEAASARAGNRAIALEQVSAAGPAGMQAVLANWQAIKALEKQENGAAAAAGYLHGVLRAQSALSEAAKLGSAAAKAGFDWPDAAGLLDKVREEAGELEQEMQNPARPQERLADELGDLLFTVANLGRHLKVDPETSLRDASAKFRRRFSAMEHASRRPLEELTSAELEEAWAGAKTAESEQAAVRPEATP